MYRGVQPIAQNSLNTPIKTRHVAVHCMLTYYTFPRLQILSRPYRSILPSDRPMQLLNLMRNVPTCLSAFKASSSALPPLRAG